MSIMPAVISSEILLVALTRLSQEISQFLIKEHFKKSRKDMSSRYGRNLIANHVKQKYMYRVKWFVTLSLGRNCIMFHCVLYLFPEVYLLN